MPPDTLMDRPGTLSAQALVGTLRRFGPTGPVYEVLEVGKVAPDGDVLLKVRVIPSGEALDYPFLQAVHDPLAD